MGEVVNADFSTRDDRYICPAFSEAEGHSIPCAQLLPRSLEGSPEFTEQDRVALCAASLCIADELRSVKACGFQKFTDSTLEEQVRIRGIADGAGNAS